ncbi:uncharacterized protein [Coffea arabica]|uniref:Reverse transcriptase zinc-binding domain-containing protein n=1 Tax=Coffea arabica TaxID=13443 RepID=A0A6P6VJ85_COFAR|nr:uncharacterized protein LOC113724333 [Coffea arabica]
MIWASTNSGAFTISSAYQIVRKGGTVSRLFASLWHRALPSKISFFMLRLLYGRLPLMDVLHKFKVLGLSRCFCCSLNPSPGTINHVFCTGEMAKQVWGCFEGLIGGFSAAFTVRHKEISLPDNSQVDFFDMIAWLRSKIVIWEVCWECPDQSVVKLNADGCSKGNLGRSGGGGLFRDFDGRFILGFSCWFGKATSL